MALAALALLVVVLLVLLPIRLHLSIQGRGEPNGAWALAGGAQLGPALASGVAARGIAPRVELRVFGRALWPRRPKPERHEEVDDSSALERAERGIQRAERGVRRLSRWLDPLDLLLFLTRERRRIRVERLFVDLDYSFEDIIVTGKLLGAIYALSGVLPSVVEIRQRPSWDLEDRFSVAGDGEIRIFPGLIVVDTLWFVIRNLRLRSRGTS